MMESLAQKRSCLAVTVESFQPAFTQQIGQLISSIQREEFGIPITLAEQPDLADISSFYQTGKGNFWIARCDCRIVGTIALLDIGDDQVALRKMFVHPDFRGAKFGTASKLLNTALAWGQEKGIAQIYLGTTSKFLAAHRFYEKNGFEEIKKEELPKMFPVLSVDSKFYMMNL